MKNTVDALKNLYVKMGGSLNDTYEDIADGSTVSNYVNIPDCIDAVTEKADASSKNLVATVDNGTVTVNLR